MNRREFLKGVGAAFGVLTVASVGVSDEGSFIVSNVQEDSFELRSHSLTASELSVYERAKQKAFRYHASQAEIQAMQVVFNLGVPNA